VQVAVETSSRTGNEAKERSGDKRYKVNIRFLNFGSRAQAANARKNHRKESVSIHVAENFKSRFLVYL